MNREQCKKNVGQLVRLDSFPPSTMCSINWYGMIQDINGNLHEPFGIGERWVLEKFTKGGLVLITLNEITIRVTPYDISELKDTL